MREADFKVRIDFDEKEEFRAVCEALDFSMSQKCRQLLKSFVEENRQQGVETGAKKQKWSRKFYDRIRV
ncbi:MAG: hypothetical protein V1257_09690 [Candidatus Neomarinimicrobiota bacterium]|jgi:antitoxin component of RelBE/YafQ-DinJ toxin-antitoxin module|nr:hypothetical protein [Candidatus Neomarinimicrobiota bacterium]|tara:strand:- start:75 stop:281 length:207 start_codon:yes stop_codon:yes gene_type:complete